MQHGVKIRGHRKLELIQLLAAGNKSQDALAAQFGVTQQAISAFKAAHAQEIEWASEDLEDEMAGLWISKKHKRVAELQDIAATFAEMEDNPKAAAIVMKALRQASEELGQLKVSIEVSGGVDYTVEGVDPKELQ